VPIPALVKRYCREKILLKFSFSVVLLVLKYNQLSITITAITVSMHWFAFGSIGSLVKCYQLKAEVQLKVR